MEKVPVIMQMEALECGAACLAMVLAYHGKWLALEKVRADCGVSRDGSNARNILRAARSYSLEAAGYRMETEDLRKCDFPVILHWNFNHFVVLCGFKKNKAVLNDPARGRVTVSLEELDRAFTGIVLCFAPAEGFTKEGKPASTLRFARERLRGSGGA
ncbi:MAG: NHLP family bacteriocin export ABC transporter peptidase/permease/ATPase, partial [Clostridiales bacterium]|nr:NHLP family bacteriocin export ABC transporter peptidase/permease/ATPase [Clostridiales bacterium]